MAVYQGTYYVKGFTIKDKVTKLPVNITGWEFESDVRDRNDTGELATLTTGGGHWVVTDGPGGRVEMRLPAELTAELPVGRLVFDVLRTNATPGPVRLFGGTFQVKTPVTRDD